MGSTLRTNIWLGMGLVALNLVIFNVLLDETRSLRLDITDGQVYSLSPVTERVVANLDEDVVIKGYFSKLENVFEDIRPLVPAIKDLLDEYAAVSNGHLKVEYIVPEGDPEEEERAQSEYGLAPNAYAYRDAREQGVKSFYFGVVVTYAGAKPVTITIDELVRQGRSIFEEKPQVELKNVEFAITRAIKKAVYGFESQRDLFAKFDKKAVITTYITPKAELPKSFEEVPDQADKVLTELAKNSNGKLTYVRGEVPKDEEGQQELARTVGVQPLALPLSEKSFYLWWALEIDGKAYRPFPLLNAEGALGEHDLREQFETVFKRLTPGVLRTIGLAQHMPDFDPMMMQRGQRPPEPPFGELANKIRSNYEVRELDLKTLKDVPPEIDVLLVMEPKEIPKEAVYALDQYVMRGGRAIICADRVDSQLQNYGQLTSTAQQTGLEDLLAAWGVQLGDEAVLDKDCGPFVWTTGTATPGRRQPFIDFDWAALPLIGRAEGGVNRDVGFLSDLEFARFWFPSALEVSDVAGIEATWLLKTSPEAWTQTVGPGLNPTPKLFPLGYAVPEEKKLAQRTLAVLLRGSFPSYFADRPIPWEAPAEDDATDGEAAGEGEKKDEAPKPPATAPLKKSEPTRVIVFGNGDWLDAREAGVTYGLGAPFGQFTANSSVIENAIDWMLEDEELMQIRNRGRSVRPLGRMEESETRNWTIANFALPLVALAGLAGGMMVFGSRRRALV